MVASLTNRNTTAAAALTITTVINGASTSITVSINTGGAAGSVTVSTNSGTGVAEILPQFNEGGPAGSGASITQQSAPLGVSSGTSTGTVAAYINQNPGQTKIAVTKEGEAYLVFGTSTAANGQTMVETANPDNPTGGTSWTPLSDFDKAVAYIDPGTGLKGTQLTANTYGQSTQGNVQQGQTYTFNGYYKDPTTGQPMVSLSDKNGKNVNLTTEQYGHDFGFLNTQGVIKNGLTPAAASTYQTTPLGGSSGTQGFSVGLSTSTQDIGNFLSGGQFPVLADDYNGKSFLIDGVNTDAHGNQTVTVQDPSHPGQTQTMSLSTAANMFHYFDRANGGVGTPFTAQSSVGGLQAGQTYTYKGMSVNANGQAQVDLTGSDHMPVSIPFSQFGTAFGSQAQKNLLDSATSNIAVENNAPSGGTYASLPNAELFAASSNAGDLKQGDYEGDCYLTSSMVALQRQDPNALKQMIRPSTDGNPHNYDVRFFVAQSNGTMAPVWVTVNDQLASVQGPSGNTSAGQNAPIDPATGKPEIGYALIEKAYAQFNQQYGTQSENGGYSGISGGLPDYALMALTGKPQGQVWPSSVGTAATWNALSQANQGTAVVVGTKEPNDPLGVEGANMFNGHAYTVVGTSVGTGGQQMVTLRNPWGVNTDLNGKPVGGDGTFTIPYSELLNDMMYCTTPISSGSTSFA